MKKQFISITLILFLICSCASGRQSVSPDSGFIISGTCQYWFGSGPGEPEISEREIDILLELRDDVSIYSPMYLIFNERKSFSLSLNLSEDGESPNSIEATILLESSMFNEISQHLGLTNRLVYHDGNGNLQYEAFEDLQRLPDRHEN
jgi:hypothetical protein